MKFVSLMAKRIFLLCESPYTSLEPKPFYVVHVAELTIPKLSVIKGLGSFSLPSCEG